MNKKELVVKRVHPQTKNVTRFNVALLSAVNMHRVQEATPYGCTSFQSGSSLVESKGSQAIKAGMVTVPFSEIADLSDESLHLLCTSDGVVTSFPKSGLDVKQFFLRIHEIFKKDQLRAPSKQKYENLMSAVLFFVDEKDFLRCHAQPSLPKASTGVVSPISELKSFMALLKEQGGVDTHRLVYYMKEASEVNYGNLQEAIGSIEEAIVAMQT
jgi:hypothetical protein